MTRKNQKTTPKPSASPKMNAAKLLTTESTMLIRDDRTHLADKVVGGIAGAVLFGFVWYACYVAITVLRS